MGERPRHRTYYLTFAVLLAFLGATLGAAYLELGAAGPPVAMAIAAAKATLVGLFFMHLAHRGAVTRLFALGGLVWLALLFTLTLTDYLTRGGTLAQSHSWAEMEAPAGAPAPQPEGRPEVRRQIETGGSVLDENAPR